MKKLLTLFVCTLVLTLAFGTSKVHANHDNTHALEQGIGQFNHHIHEALESDSSEEAKGHVEEALNELDGVQDVLDSGHDDVTWKFHAKLHFLQRIATHLRRLSEAALRSSDQLTHNHVFVVHKYVHIFMNAVDVLE